jgi:antitoxin VapB
MPFRGAFKPGNSQAVRFPTELAYQDTNVELSIDRYGDVIVIASVCQNLKEMVTALRSMPKPSQIEQTCRSNCRSATNFSTGYRWTRSMTLIAASTCAFQVTGR